jgi:TetR/AcrR family acrAB operon transcriptional repressor
MPRRTKKEALETRNRILDAAEKVFGEYGVASTSLADVAHAANMTRGAIYWHFKNKSDLFESVCVRSPLPMEIIATASEDEYEENPPGSLQAIFLSAIEEAVRDPNSQRIFAHPENKQEFLDPAGALLLRRRESMCRSKTLFTRILDHAVAKGDLPADLDTDLAGKALRGIINGLLSEWMLAPSSFDLMAEAERLLSASMDAMRCAPALRRTE